MSKLRDKIHAFLARAEGARVRVIDNSDGSIDGEALLSIERGESVEAGLEEMERLFNRQFHAAKLFFATGFRWEPRPDDDAKYDRYRGLFQVFSHYYHDLPESVALTETMLDGMRRRRFRKPIQAIVRVHWNKHGTKPPRESK